MFHVLIILWSTVQVRADPPIKILTNHKTLQNPNKNRYLAVFLCTIKSKEP
jgi:hypothetical protein